MKLTHDAHSPSVERPNQRVKPMRFSYPGGSRPLDGYTIKRGIGIGGFGEVYFALNDAGKEVALKRIQRNLDIELRGVRQCLNLKHVNLIKLWDIRTSEAGESWVVMEYVPGESLRDVIERHPRGMANEQIRWWFEATCAGVAYLHDRGIVHRDLKPGNIFRDDDEKVVKIGDYGLSKFISCSNRDGQTESVGTFHYMAPEIGKGVYGKEIDIYALGIILFEMLTGRVPFEGESSQEIIMKHLTTKPELAGLGPPWQSVIERTLAKDPRDRFHEVEELLQAIDSPETLSASAGETGRVPTQQPMFIGDDHRASDNEIRFGEVRQIVDAEVTRAGTGPQGSVAHDPALAVTVAGKTPNEPIARAVHGGWQQTMDWWNRSHLNTPVKVAILAGLSILLVFNFAWMLPVSIGLGLLYLVYYAIRSIFVSKPADSVRPEMPIARKLTRAERTSLLRTALARRPAGDRTTELVGSLVVSAIVCLVLGFFALLVLDGASTPTSRWAWYAWTVVTSIVGSWSILMVSKTWEHRQGEADLRRFVMLCVGLMTGGFAWLTAGYLHLDWQEACVEVDTGWSPLPAAMFADGATPTVIGSLLFFGVLFGVLRWWKLADPARRTRLSMLGVGWCLIWATLGGCLFHFPIPWCSIVAVMVAIATQLAAPWITPQQRERVVRSGGDPRLLAASGPWEDRA